MPAIRSHSTDVQAGTWDGPTNVTRLRNEDGAQEYRQMFAWYDPDGNPDAKSTYRFAHHYVKTDGTVGAASITACRAGIAVLNGGRGGTTIPSEDYKGVWDHLARHLRDAELEPPTLKTQEEMSVVSSQSAEDGDLGVWEEMQTHAAVIGKTRREVFEGREFLVAPVVALVPGVLNGFLNPADEVAKYVDAWNDAPVPIGHPTRGGVNVSARSLDVLAHNVIGRFQNVTFEENRLKGELWLEIEKAERVGDVAVAVLAALEAGEPVEVSTAYFADQELVSGEWNGKPYQGINRNIRPDHLALLPGAKGACSWQDGCGAPRVHEVEAPDEGGRAPRVHEAAGGRWQVAGSQTGEGNDDAILKTGGDMKVTIALELSLDEQLAQVYEAFNARFAQAAMMAPMEPAEVPWIREVFTDRVIADTGKGLVAVPYTRSDTGGIEFGEPVPVEVVYQPIGAGGTTATNRQQTSGGCPCMDDEQRVNANDVNEEPQEGGTPEAAAEPQTPALPADLVEFQNLMAELGGVQGVREMLAGLKANADTERANLIADLTANERCVFSADELRALPKATLDKLAQSLRPADYSGRGGPRTHQQADEWTVLAAPEVK